jgi:hypothetical protein
MTTTWQIGSKRSTSSRLTGGAFLAAPLLVIGYGVVRLNDGQRGPGAGWTSGHLMFALSLFGFGLVLRELWRSARPGVARAVFAVVGGAGLLSVLVQIAIDLYVGAVSPDRAAMDAHYTSIQSVPGVTPAVYSVGPLLFYVGLISLAVLASGRPWQRFGRRLPVLLAVGVVVALLGLDFLPLTGLCFALALVPEGLRLLGRRRALPGGGLSVRPGRRVAASAGRGW